MHFKHLLPIIPLVGSVLALPTSTDTTAATPSPPIDQALQNIKYTVMALRSASPVHFLSLNAIAGRLYLGGKTTSYCPPEIESSCECPPGNLTVFDGSCALSAKSPEYPAGQTLWNTDDGVIGYDFSQVRPEDTYNCPWYLETSQNSAFAARLRSTYGADGFLACPTGEDGIWQVLRAVGQNELKPPQGDASKCLGVSLVALQYNQTEYGAWVYS